LEKGSLLKKVILRLGIWFSLHGVAAHILIMWGFIAETDSLFTQVHLAVEELFILHFLVAVTLVIMLVPEESYDDCIQIWRTING
jgi:hypothetical protein